MAVKTLAVVSCMFNPHRGKNRIRNYAIFADNLAKHNLPLFTIEATFGYAPEVASTWQIAIDPDAVLWHKERLLNIAIERLPDEYDAVLWCDADILFDTNVNNLREQCIAALNRSPVIQPWSHSQFLDAYDRPSGHWMRSMALYNSTIATPNASPRVSHPGFAWGAQRELLASCGGMYDRAITGSGDTAFAYGCWKDPVYCQAVWNERHFADLNNWADCFYPKVNGNVGYVDVRIQHLWHGTIKDRKYDQRHIVLSENGFDIAEHLATAPNGTMCWSAKAPQKLKDALRNYLYGRKEDGTLFSAEQREEALKFLADNHDCSIAEFRHALYFDNCRQLLAELEAKRLITKRWLKRAYRYSLTAEGRKVLSSLLDF